jgi:hypothetical protein
MKDEIQLYIYILNIKRSLTDKLQYVSLLKKFCASAYQIARSYPLSGILDASNFETQKHRLMVSTRNLYMYLRHAGTQIWVM